MQREWPPVCSSKTENECLGIAGEEVIPARPPMQPLLTKVQIKQLCS